MWILAEVEYGVGKKPPPPRCAVNSARSEVDMEERVKVIYFYL